jgi:hypothetical protein
MKGMSWRSTSERGRASYLSFIIFPNNSELDDAFRNCGNLKGFLIFWVLFEQGRVLEGRRELWKMSHVKGKIFLRMLGRRPECSRTFVGLLKFRFRWQVGHCG